MKRFVVRLLAYGGAAMIVAAMYLEKGFVLGLFGLGAVLIVAAVLEDGGGFFL